MPSEQSVFASMIGTHLDRLFGFTAPFFAYAEHHSMWRARVQACMPIGYFGNASVDASPTTYVPQAVLPHLLLLEMRPSIGEAGWPQAPFGGIVASFSTLSAVLNDRVVFVGSRRSSVDTEGPFLVARAQNGIGVASVLQLGAFPAANNMQSHMISLRRNASDASGNEIVSMSWGRATRLQAGCQNASKSRIKFKGSVRLC